MKSASRAHKNGQEARVMISRRVFVHQARGPAVSEPDVARRATRPAVLAR
ncbi:hypothetical protein [Nonomuraea sp. NPDC003754]